MAENGNMMDAATVAVKDSPLTEAPALASADGVPAQQARNFDAVLADVEIAAQNWGVRSDLMEGRFVAALMAAVRWTGSVSEAAQAEFRRLFQENREAAELELARAREITRAAQASLTQTRNAMIGLQVERETVVARMIHDTLPLFAERLQGALVLREKAWSDGVRMNRLAIAGGITLCVFLGGFALKAWQDSDVIAALGNCLAHPLEAQGRIYCDVTRFRAGSP